MKNLFKVLEAMRSIAIIALIAVIGFSFAACGDDGGGGGGGGSGTFTLTSIPSPYNGCKVTFSGQKNFSNDLYGRATVISNRSASIPVLIGGSLTPYSGSDTMVTLRFNIIDLSETTALYGKYTNNVVFSNGSAALSFNDITWDAAGYP